MASPKKASVIEAALKKKGFKRNKTKGNHHKYYYFVDDNGEFTAVYTYISHDGKHYDDHLLKQMSLQLRLSKSQLNQLIECPLSKKALMTIYKDKGLA